MCIYAYHLGMRVDQLKDDWNIKMGKTPKDGVLVSIQKVVDYLS